MTLADAAPLAGRTAWITGASQGIGAATARRLAGAGARVVLTARRPEPLVALADEVDGIALPGDVTDADAMTGLAARIAEELGEVPDLVVGSAGVFSLGPVEGTEPGIFRWNLDVNLQGAFHLVRAVLPAMKARGSGTIVQVGSVAGRKAFPGNAAYAASKFGVRGFHQVLLEELRGSGIRATLLEPAATDTPIWDSMDPDSDPDLPPRTAMLRPDDVADAIHFVATRPENVQIPYLPLEAC